MRNYSNTAVETELLVSANDVAPTLTVKNTGGWPDAPFTVVIRPDSPDEEVCLVTGKQVSAGGTTLTVSRGWGGSTAFPHPADSRVRHGAVAEDFREASLAYRHLFGEPVYDPNNPTAPPTNAPLVPTTDVVTKSASTWGELLPTGYVSPIPQTGGANP